MPSLGKLSELTATIQTRTSEIEEYMRANELPQTTFDLDSPLELQLSPHLSRAREETLEALTDLHALLLGPLPYLTRLLSPAVNIFNSLQTIYRFNVAQHLGYDERITYEELASRCKLKTGDLRRFLRLAIANHVFQEPYRNVVGHSAMSRIIAEKEAFRDWIGLVCEEMLPASICCVDAMIKWPGSSDPAHTGFALANGSKGNFFDEIGKDPYRASRFANGMAVNASAPALSPSFFISNVPWSADSPPRAVVDIGGSHGIVGREMLKRFPKMDRYVVQDLPEVTAGVHDSDGEEGRLVFEEYDFFTEQTFKDADIYILRLVLHDWPDEKAIAILKNQIPAMGRQSKIILNEICLPNPGELTHYQEQFLRGFDLSMKHVYNGKERDADEWNALIAQVDPRLQTQQIISPPGSLLSLIEIAFK